MKKATKAALMSALVFPGAGQIWMARYVSGGIFAGIAFVALYYLVVKLSNIVVVLWQDITMGLLPVDPIALRQWLEDNLSDANSQRMNMALVVFSLAWVISIVEAWWVATHRRDDHAKQE